MIILGIDPGSLATGYGVVDLRGNRARRLAAGCVRPQRQAPLPARLLAIHTAVGAVMAAHDVQAVAVESLFNARNARASLVLGHARGVILLAAAAAGLPVLDYSPREVKLALTGHGNATKEQVSWMVCRWLGLTSPPASLDESDALAVALCHGLRAAAPAARAARGGAP